MEFDSQLAVARYESNLNALDYPSLMWTEDPRSRIPGHGTLIALEDGEQFNVDAGTFDGIFQGHPWQSDPFAVYQGLLSGKS